MCVNSSKLNGEEELDRFLKELMEKVSKQYDKCIINSQKMLCQLNNQEIGKSGKKVFTFNKRSLVDAIQEVAQDIRFLITRRGKLIGGMRPTKGKIAGIIAFRLAKNQIIHLMEGCACCPKQCAVWLNSEFALKCAWAYIGIKYTGVSASIRQELFYTLNYRHVNQETLGLVFDTIQETYGSKTT
jgi:hypothetical protein